MPANEAKPKTDTWLSPSSGWPQRSPLRYIRLCIDFAADASAAWARLPPILSRLIDLFGPHTSQVNCSRLKPSAWSTDFPWRQSTYHSYAKLPVASMAEPAAWARLLECSEDTRVHLTAYRGGGASRHLVWAIDRGRSGQASDSIELHLATRHISDRGAIEAEKLILEFFRLASTLPVRAGYGEFVRVNKPDEYTFMNSDEGADRWLNNAFLSTDLGQTDSDPLVPRWCTLLTPRHLQRLGGFGHLYGRGVESLRSLRGDYYACGSDPVREDLLPLHRIGDSALFQMQPLSLILMDGGGQWPRPSLPSPTMWFLDELSSAGLHAAQRTDRLRTAIEIRRRDREKDREEARRRTRVPKERVIPMSAFTPASIEKHPPRCFRSSCTHDASPPGFPNRFHAQAYRLNPRDLAQAMTIYGRRARGNALLASPILVGSLDPDRAALFFDERIHGHDGENSPPAPESARPIGRLTQLSCPKCAGRLFHAWAAFEFPDDLVLPKNKGARPQDFFSWFWLSARCANCGWTDIVVDTECA